MGDWAEWPEEGTPDGSMLHSVIVDPRDPDHLYLGLSGGGVFESTDGGARLGAAQRRHARPTSCPTRPCPTATTRTASACTRPTPDRLYQQNHCGIYRLDRPADDVDQRIGDNMPRDVGDIGFPVEVHPRDPDTAWVFPMDGTDVWPRTSPDGRPAVYVTRDAGATWAAPGRRPAPSGAG